MATNWITLVGADLGMVIAAGIEDKVNENLGDHVEPGRELDLSADNRRDALLEMAVGRIRGAIQNGGRVPISVTAFSIPKEAKIYALMLAAMPLVQSTPSLAKEFLVGQDGRKTSFERMYDRAEEWLMKVEAGLNVTYPTDPVGRDGITAVTDSNPLFQAVRFGSVGNIHQSDLVIDVPGFVDDSDTDVPPVSAVDTSNISGEFAIPEGVEEVEVTGLEMPSVPSQIVVSVRKPEGGFNVFASVIKDTPTKTGFRVALSGVTDSDEYVLVYIALF